MKHKLKKTARIYSKLFVRSLKRTLRKVLIQNTYSRLFRKYAKMEAGLASYHILKASGTQLIKRPRVKLAAATILTLVFLMVISAKSASALKARESDIKINGKAVLVAQKYPENYNVESEIVVTIDPVLSPFDYKYPVENGLVTQTYSSYHRAYDIATSFGSEIKPIGSGVVEFAGTVTDGKGNIVVIDHGDGLVTIYAHMNKIQVEAGNIVDGNSVLGTIGLTGHTTGPHVHFEVYDNGVPVNPGSVLPN